MDLLINERERAAYENHDSLENKEGIANMINEGGIGVEAHYPYNFNYTETIRHVQKQTNSTNKKDNS